MIEAGHNFLARVGKKRLRPGGKKATVFLLKSAKIEQDTAILEVASNMGTTLVPLVRKTKAKAIGVDLDSEALEKAKALALKKKVADKVSFIVADATKLPFADQSFDVVINEAMLTMQREGDLHLCLKEYYRVLKPGGLLLTHDVKLTAKASKETLIDLRKAINVGATPKSVDGWHEAFRQNGFVIKASIDGKMTLLSPAGMIRDEGLLRTIKIVRNAHKKENRAAFFKMYNMFKRRKDELGFIAVVSQKPA